MNLGKWNNRFKSNIYCPDGGFCAVVKFNDATIIMTLNVWNWKHAVTFLKHAWFLILYSSSLSGIPSFLKKPDERPHAVKNTDSICLVDVWVNEWMDAAAWRQSQTAQIGGLQKRWPESPNRCCCCSCRWSSTHIRLWPCYSIPQRQTAQAECAERERQWRRTVHGFIYLAGYKVVSDTSSRLVSHSCTAAFLLINCFVCLFYLILHIICLQILIFLMLLLSFNYLLSFSVVYFLSLL